MKKLLSLWMFLPIFLVLAACSDNSEDIDRYYATVSTPKVTTTTPTSLTVTASVTGDLNQIVKKGFCYSAAASVPTIKDHVVDADENFSASLSTLTSGTSYAQYYLGINKVDMNDLNFALTIEGGHLVF